MRITLSIFTYVVCLTCNTYNDDGNDKDDDNDDNNDNINNNKQTYSSSLDFKKFYRNIETS